MSFLAAMAFVGVVTYFAWALCANHLIGELRRLEPKLYADIGAPTGYQLWWRPFGSSELDPLILRRQFRKVGILDPKLLRALEFAYWLRWALLLSVVGFAVALFGSAVDRHAP